MKKVASVFFTSIASVASHLPEFRGKNGVFLRLFDILGLAPQHIYVDKLLCKPTQYRVRLDLHSWLQRLAFVSGGYEPSTVSFLIKVYKSLESPGYVLDIGANIGLIGIPTALIINNDDTIKSNKPVVVCIEAVPDNEVSLRNNVNLNDAGDLISVIGTGLGEVDKTVDIQVEGDLKAGEGTGTANIIAEGSAHECIRIPIEITTLDALMQSSSLPDNCKLIKIDTDGYDLKILQGARNFLNKNRPVIYGEFAEHCLKWHNQGVVDVLLFAKEINYLAWQRIPGGGFRFTRSFDFNGYSQDVLLVPAEYENALAWCL